MNELLIQIQLMLPSLPRSEAIIAEAMLENPEAIEYMTLAQLSKDSGASEAAIIRFSRRLGFDGYTAMKHGFIESRQKSAELLENPVTREKENMRSIMEKTFRDNVLVMRETIAQAGDEFDQAVDALENAGAIHFFGTGDGYACARLAYMKFKRLGIVCSCEEDAMLQLITAGNMTAQDVAIAVSYEGRSRNVIRALKIAKQNGSKTISITRMRNSPLMEYTDICLRTAVRDLTAGRDKVTRRVSDQFILEVLYLGYINRMGEHVNELLMRSQAVLDGNKIR